MCYVCVICNMCMYMCMMHVYDVYVGEWAYMHVMMFMPGLWRRAPHLTLCRFWRTQVIRPVCTCLFVPTEPSLQPASGNFSWLWLSFSFNCFSVCREWVCICLHLCVCMYMFMYIYVHEEAERQPLLSFFLKFLPL